MNLFKKNYENITSDDVKKRMNDPETIILDVREFNEYRNGHIPKAVLMPLGTLPSRTFELNKDKSYIVVCASGGRSSSASTFLSKEGFKVSNLSGGMMLWNGPIEK